MTKILSLRKKIIKNLALSFCLIAGFIVIYSYNFYISKNHNNEIAKLDSQTSEIKAKYNQLLEKVTQFQKYQEIWKKIPPLKKEIRDVKIDFVNSKIDELAQKHSISKPDLKMIIPENLNGGAFGYLSTVKIAKTNGDLSFNAINDLKAISFISELANSMPGYFIVKSFDMKKEKIYTNEDFVKISTGEFNGLVNVRVSFTWYIYKKII